MMLTGKQRARLRSMANDMDTIMQVGKDGVNENMIKTVSDALEARELIKMRALENSGMTAREAAEELAEALGADVVSVVGTRFVLYRRSEKNPKIELA
jgi:RNA-binding protein